MSQKYVGSELEDLWRPFRARDFGVALCRGVASGFIICAIQAGNHTLTKARNPKTSRLDTNGNGYGRAAQFLRV